MVPVLYTDIAHSAVLSGAGLEALTHIAVRLGQERSCRGELNPRVHEHSPQVR